METFSMSLAICDGNSPVTGEFPSQRPVTRSFDVFSDLLLKKRLSKLSRRHHAHYDVNAMNPAAFSPSLKRKALFGTMQKLQQ